MAQPKPDMLPESLIQRNRSTRSTCLASAVIVLLSAVYSLVVVSLNAPFRVYNSDVYHQIAVLQEMGKEEAAQIGDPYFLDGPADLHGGPYYYVLSLLSIVAPVESTYDLILVAAIFNVLFLLCALYMFGRAFGLGAGSNVIFLFISLFGWGSYNFYFAGLFSFTNLLITGSFPATMGFASITLGLALYKMYLQAHDMRVLVLSALLQTGLLVSHMLSGVMLISLSGLLLLESVYSKKIVTREHVLYGLAIVVSVLASCFVWPLFGLLEMFSSATPVQLGQSDKVTENLFALEYWQLLLGPSVLGVIYLIKSIKERRYFVALLVISSGLIALLYLSPIRISLYWRYFPFIYLGLSFLLVQYLARMPRVWATTVLMLLMTTGVYGEYLKAVSLTVRASNIGHEFSEIVSELPNDVVVLSDPNTSYHLITVANVKVVAVPYNHANPVYISESKKRYEDAYDFFTSPSSTEIQSEFVQRYGIQYVLINQEYQPDYIKFDTDRTWLQSFSLQLPHEVIFKNSVLKLYKLTI